MKNFWSWWTDVKDRPAIELAIGTFFYAEVALLAAWPLWDHSFHPDPNVLGMLIGAATALVITNAVGNVALDKKGS